MPVDLDLCYAPAADLARRIRAGELSPVHVVGNALARIAEVDPVLNAFCFTYPDEALAEARAVEQARDAGHALGPLAGVPVAIKDLTATRGRRTTMGSHAFEHWVPDADAVVVERLKAAGAIVVGKTTTPEFAFAGYTASPLWGITRNPWEPGRIPGGSSGGAGVAVATGCVPLAEGSDMGGSVRIPAALCGTVGLKPSLGRIPMDILPSQFDTLSHFGPLARSVEDAMLFLRATQGPDDRDYQSQGIAADLPWPPEAVEGMRLALSADLGFYAVEPYVAANLRETAAALRAAGAVVDEVELGWTAAVEEAWEDLWAVFLAALFGEHLDPWRDRMDPGLVTYMERGFALDAVRVKRLEIVRTEAWRRLAPVLRDYDALLCPTCTREAPPIDGPRPPPSVAGFVSTTMTSPFNLLGLLPVLAVPTGFGPSGLPTSMQIVGRRGDDPTVLRVGAAVEAARPWADRWPPI